jgi:hypothetical protein
MTPVTNPKSDTIESYMHEYIDNPSSINQRKYNIEIVDNIIEKLKQINHEKDYRTNLDFNVLKPSSQALKNNTLEEVSVHILTNNNESPCPIYITPREYISALLAIGAEITAKAEQNLFDFYTQHIIGAKNSINCGQKQYNIKQANEVRGFLKPGRIFPEIEQKLDNLDKKIDKLQQQTTDLQKQANSINNKATRIENNQSQCCVIL